MTVSAIHTGVSPAAHASKPMGSAQLGAAFTHLTKGLTYTSEADYPYAFVAVKDNHLPLSGANVMRLLAPELKRTVFTDPKSRQGLIIELEASGAKAKKALKEMSDVSDPNDAQEVKDAKKLGQAFGLFGKNVSGVRQFKIGPKEDGSNKLATDSGLYAYVFVGRTRDGKIAAVTYGAAET